MELRALDETPPEAVYTTYLEAFADYSVPVHPDRVAFAGMLKRRGARMDRSVGAFDGERLVGLQVTGLGDWGFDGVPTAYDVFTCLLPEVRGQGLAGKLFDKVRALLRPGEADQFLLECIQTNERGLRAYAKQGFEVTRGLECFEIPRERLRTQAPAANVALREIDSPPWIRLSDLRSWHPSWQNGNGSLQRADPAPVYVAATRDDALVGFAALFPETGDLAQLSVHPAHHRQGIATALLAACTRRLRPDVQQVRVVNVPSDATSDLAFYEAVGAEVFTRQFEMLKTLG